MESSNYRVHQIRAYILQHESQKSEKGQKSNKKCIKLAVHSAGFPPANLCF